ncbi:ROK family protein [Candidatus Saccharibacteria bacterium]|nr:ROK family protein [Candidatus Saccharibacteria bacterium]
MRQFLTIDTGGTKTRIVQFAGDFSSPSEAYAAPVLREVEIPTPHDKSEYILEITNAIKQNFPDFIKSPEENVVILATLGQITNGILTTLRLGWVDFPIAKNLSNALGGAKVLVENDAKIGTVGAFPPDFRGRGLFITLGTGIGAGMMIDGELSHDLARTEPGHIAVEHDGKLVEWEDFASAKAWFERSGGRRGEDVPADDPIWRWYAEGLAAGIVVLLPVLYPDKIVIGGRMAEVFDKYADYLREIVAERAWPPVARVEFAAVSDPHYATNRGALVFGLRQMEKMNED